MSEGCAASRASVCERCGLTPCVIRGGQKFKKFLWSAYPVCLAIKPAFTSCQVCERLQEPAKIAEHIQPKQWRRLDWSGEKGCVDP